MKIIPRRQYRHIVMKVSGIASIMLLMAILFPIKQTLIMAVIGLGGYVGMTYAKRRKDKKMAEIIHEHR